MLPEPAPLSGVSVVVPTHNTPPELLRRALRSVAEQSAWNILLPDLIVVDDASADQVVVRQAVEELGEIGKTKPRLFCLPQNLGHAGALNAGIAEAKCPVVAFLDADDVWYPTKIARQLEALLADLSCDGVVCLAQEAAYRKDESGTSLLDFGEPKLARMFSALVIWRSSLNIIGAPRRGLGMGTTIEWFDRAEHLGSKIEVVQEPLYRRVHHASNYTRLHRDNMGEYHLALKIILDRRRAARG